MIDPERPDYSNSPVASMRPGFDYRLASGGSGVPVVSVLTPFFNTDQVFLETAESLLRQSFQDFEWIIVDDGSTDEAALNRLRALEARDGRVRVVTQVNAGPAAARNVAARHASGRYLCLLDSDDMLEPTFIEKCIWFLESNPEFAFCNAWTVNFGDETFLWTIGFERGSAHLVANSGPPIAVVRKSAFDDAGGFDESIRLGHEDWDFWLALAKAGHWGHTLPEYLAWYRKRSTGRFHQVMRESTVHRNFQAQIAKKFAGLRKDFPAPAIKFPVPYETPPVDIPFANRLGKPDGTKRILLLLPWMVTGGADRVNLEWVTALLRNGYQVSICATLNTYHGWHAEFAKLTPDVFVLPHFLRCADYPRFLRYLIDSRRIDMVLMSHCTFGYLTLPYLRAYFPGITFVDLSHVEEVSWWNGGHPRFGVGYQEMLDLNLVTTEHLRDWMVARGATSERIAVCRSGIDTTQLDAVAVEKSANAGATDKDVPVIVFAGRICAQKRPLFLADILQSLDTRGIEFKALIVGDGDLRPELERRLQPALVVGRVRMLGTIEHAAWLRVLGQADIFLLPSSYEGISIALLEAMGMGVVPVTAAVGGQGEVVAAASGYLIPQGDGELERYVDALSALVADRHLRESMGEAARRKVIDEYSLPETTATLLAALDRARTFAATEPRAPVLPRYAEEVATNAVELTRVSGVANFLWEQRYQSRQGGPARWSMNPRHWLRWSLMSFSKSSAGSLLRRSPRVRAWGRRVMATVKAW